MRRRLFVALLAAGLLLVAGFTAAAVASGGGPFALLEDQPRAADDTITAAGTIDRKPEKTSSAKSTEDKSREDEAGEDEKAPKKTATDSTTSSHKVTICHHTGSKKHAFHPISVDEHALRAHTAHGDTVGSCPATTASTAPAAKHGKPKHSGGKAKGAGGSQRSEQGRKNGKDQSHRRGERAGGPTK